MIEFCTRWPVRWSLAANCGYLWPEPSDGRLHPNSVLEQFEGLTHHEKFKPRAKKGKPSSYKYHQFYLIWAARRKGHCTKQNREICRERISSVKATQEVFVAADTTPLLSCRISTSSFQRSLAVPSHPAITSRPTSQSPFLQGLPTRLSQCLPSSQLSLGSLFSTTC